MKKFDYAVFLLQGDAYNWWKTVPHSLVQPPVLTWDDFLREYHEKYAPSVYKKEKRREFIELKQNNLTMAEYGLRFTQLSVYAANLITTEEEKCQKFEEGLTYDIRSRLTPYDLENFSRLMAAAIRAEKLVKEKKAISSTPRESGSRSEKRKEYLTIATKGGNNENRSTSSKRGRTETSSQTGQGSNASQKCSACHKYHVGECRKLTGGCYRCGVTGHRVCDCPEKQYTNRTGSGPSVQGKTPSAGPSSGTTRQ